MRMRFKKWAGPELDACPFFIRHPDRFRGRWHSLFPRGGPVYLELGCGKGLFLSGAAPADPRANYIGVDLKDSVLGPARRNIEKAYREAGRKPDNILLTAMNIEHICDAMGPADSVDRIYISFCNPWPKPRHHKRRLTYPRQLESYGVFLKPGGELFFKTDDGPFYEDTVRYLLESGYEIVHRTGDLYATLPEGNIPTEFEKVFRKRGVAIKALTAVYRGRERKGLTG